MIGERLKSWRKSENLTQQAIARSISSSSGYISEIEQGKTIPGGNFLISLNREYGVDINWLLTGGGYSPIKGPAQRAAEGIYDEEERPKGLAQRLNEEGGYIGIVDEDPAVAELLEGARRVLKSGNPIAFDALERNIRYFDHAVASEKRLMAVEAKLEELMQVLSERKKSKKAANDE